MTAHLKGYEQCLGDIVEASGASGNWSTCFQMEPSHRFLAAAATSARAARWRARTRRAKPMLEQGFQSGRRGALDSYRSGGR